MGSLIADSTANKSVARIKKAGTSGYETDRGRSPNLICRTKTVLTASAVLSDNVKPK